VRYVGCENMSTVCRVGEYVQNVGRNVHSGMQGM